MFTPFTQADNSVTRKYGGTGLGLSIVLKLANLMGGTAGAESTPGQGSRFWFRIRADVVDRPDAVAGLEAEAQASIPHKLKLAAGKILIVEDNGINQMVIEDLLEGMGAESVCVENGQEAIDILLNGLRPSLILMDMQMPVMDGITATQLIREWEKGAGLPPLPIVALTANAFDEDRQHCQEAGMNDFLSKPIDVDELSRILSRWIGIS